MVSIKFFPLDIDYFNHKNLKAVRIFGRTESGKRVCFLDREFEQYFWVILDKEYAEDLKKRIAELRLSYNDEVVYATRIERQKKNYLGKEIDALKVFVNSPSGVELLRSAIWGMKGVSGIKEVDIPIHRRYLIDKQIDMLKLCLVEGEVKDYGWNVDIAVEGKIISLPEEKICEPKILSFDIEVTSSERYPRVEKDPIILISFFGENFKKVLACEEADLDYVESVKDEAEILEKFKELINNYQPDYLVGYFSDGFDFPYIKRRAEINHIKLELGLDSEPIKIHKARGAEINGVVHLDILNFIRNILGNSLKVESFSLNSIATELLGEKKEKIDFEIITDMLKKKDRQKFEELCKYGLKDAELTYNLCKKVLPNLHELAMLINQPVFDISRMRFSQLVEWYIIKNMGNFNEICPNKPLHWRERKTKSYEGAFVFEPKPGLYENIIVFDFRSLYPSLIYTKNICPSTITEKETDAYETPTIDGKKYYFTKNQRGFIPQIIGELIKTRLELKKSVVSNKDPLLKAREQSLKLLANAMYGYYGFAGARWYCWEAAASVTSFGREYIHKTIESAKKSGFEVIYADTDSIVVILNKKTRAEAIDFLSGFNKELPDMMELEFEGFYPRGIFVMKKQSASGAKKKYALIDEKGELKVVGFETVRRDWSLIAKRVQDDVLRTILKEHDIKKAINYVKKVVYETRAKKVDFKEMVIQSQLKKDLNDYEQIGPHVAVAQRMKKSGFYIEPGMIIKYIITEGEGMIRDKARFIGECIDYNYDSEYYINNQIYPAIEKIFDALGCPKEELIEDENQKKLSSYQNG